MRVEELLALVVEFVESAGLGCSKSLRFGPELDKFVEHVVADLPGLLGGKAHGGVVVGDRCFGVVDMDGALHAVGAALLAADAHEVLVDGSPAVLGVADDEPAATLAAVDGALEVVRVFSFAFTRGVVCSEEFLDRLPCLGADERPAYRVDFDVTNFATVDDAPDVEVAGRCFHRRPTGLGFLGAAFDDFVGEVAAVELGDRAHDPVHQDPGRCLVDVLANGHQLHAAGFEFDTDGDVVDAVAGEAVALVHDHVRHRVLAHVTQETLDLGPVDGRVQPCSPFVKEWRL